MGELAIRRNLGLPVVQYQGKTEKGTGTKGPTAARPAVVTVSETLRQLMTRMQQPGESRRAFQMGEAVLAEVRDSLGRMAELARESAEGSAPDREALQKELEQLREGIDRMIRSAGGETKLFYDGDGPEGVQKLPDWLVKGMAQGTMTADQILGALGLDATASSEELMAALAKSSLESNSAAGYLAALYLGAVISGSGPEDPEGAMEGLRLLLEKVAQGLSPDEAIALLTKGAFTGLEDFQSQFTGGTAPGLEAFLTKLLLSGEGSPVLPGFSAAGILAELEGMNLQLLMGLLSGGQSTGPAAQAEEPPLANQAAAQTAETPRGEEAVRQFGSVRASGRDLSGVSFQAKTGEMTIRGGQDVALRGSGLGETAALRLTGSGTVTVENMKIARLIVEGPAGRLFSGGANTVLQIQLREGSALTLDGDGLLKLGKLQAAGSNRLCIAGGAMLVMGEKEAAPGRLEIPVLLEGAASLAALSAQVSRFDGKPLEPFDLLWKTMLPGWSGITALEVNGQQSRTALLGGAVPDPVRLWLDKGDASHGYPIHTVVIRGKDASGQPMTRYTYLRWNQYTREFQEISMYPNPFTVTGGEPGRDWIYDEASHTLHILSAQVTAIAGGTGVDARKEAFSGRIALADGIGAVELALDGVVCRVSSGRAFRLGRGNDVTLLLQNGTDNLFESGAGCAGISLGDGTSLRIDCAARLEAGEDPAGTLDATIGVGAQGAQSDILTMEMGKDTVTWPQFCLSSRVLQLDQLNVSTQACARAARTILEADCRWVSQIQKAYHARGNRLEPGPGKLRREGLVRDAAMAGTAGKEAKGISPQDVQAMLWKKSL